MLSQFALTLFHSELLHKHVYAVSCDSKIDYGSILNRFDFSEHYVNINMQMFSPNTSPPITKTTSL